MEYQSIRPDLRAGERPTRDILHVVGLVPSRDTLDVFVTHFPSRSGGERESEWKRLIVARQLKRAVDSLVRVRQGAKILIMGDFNDYPQNKSISEVLGVRLLKEQHKEKEHKEEQYKKRLVRREQAIKDQTIKEQTTKENNMKEQQSSLYHLLAHTLNKKNQSRKNSVDSAKKEPAYGSYKYQGEWGLLDHLMVSGKLLDSSSRFYTDGTMAEVIKLPFLLVEDEKFGGQQPFRTYHGMKYQGGYSDHLPVRVDFVIDMSDK